MLVRLLSNLGTTLFFEEQAEIKRRVKSKNIRFFFMIVKVLPFYAILTLFCLEIVRGSINGNISLIVLV
jgi:hypothetical protein